MSTTFTDLVLTHWRDTITGSNVAITGHHLTIGDVVVVARQPNLCKISLAAEAVEAIARCSNVIDKKLAQGEVIYGVNTGFGGSADTRTKAGDHGLLQQSLLNHLMCGVMANGGKQPHENGVSSNGASPADLATMLPLDDPLSSTCMPESWARAAMLVRSNSLAGGASGIRVCIAESLVELLTKDIIPRIPIRGTISASGDLCALSYIGAILQGRSSATAFVGHRSNPGNKRRIVRADKALHDAGITPITFRAKEGLAIVNGTAASAGVSALAVHECINIAALSQILTAMSVEALNGTKESFEPFIAKVRPHPGQVDSARNIFGFLADSKMLAGQIGSGNELRQDRYSIRTASQWIGPVLEDFMLAYRQITIELNSVTDNPLIEVGSDDQNIVYHGGNFQAKVLTSAVEKLRQGLQTIGRMLFSQCTELINPATNRGLPPNLVSDEPSQSFLFKGIDVMTAALTSELGFLANPVGSHVQTAEMGNQALNSLALISARYTLDAIDVTSQLAASHIMCLCQALDLRALMIEFQNSFKPIFCNLFTNMDIPINRQESYWTSFLRNCEKMSNLDSPARFRTAIGHLVPDMIQDCALSAHEMKQFIDRGTEAAITVYLATRSRCKENPGVGASPYLGRAARRIYKFVREDLRVPFLGEVGLGATPEGADPDGVSASVGTYQTIIYEAVRSGRLYSVVVKCFEEAANNVEERTCAL